MKKALSIALSAIAMFCLLVGAIMTCVEWVAYDTNFYSQQYTRLGIEAYSGLAEGELMPLTQRIIDYLADRQPDLNMQVTVDGQTQQAFDDRELAHMSDVRALFRTGGTVRLVAWVICAALILLLIILRNRVRTLLLGALIGCGLFLLALLTLFVWGAIDFTGLFTLFHRMSFSNDLWLLDPRTELLIRLVPEQFFIACATRIALYLAAWIAIPAVGFGIALHFLPRRAKEEAK